MVFMGLGLSERERKSRILGEMFFNFFGFTWIHSCNLVALLLQDDDLPVLVTRLDLNLPKKFQKSKKNVRKKQQKHG